MQANIKDQKAILAKLGIPALNRMQQEAQKAISGSNEIVLLSPTGTGKTLAFLLPLMAELDPELMEVQLLILVPSRELAIQIEQVARDMGSGLKINAVYGGRSTYKDKIDLKHPPAILIGTPGRVADHLRRDRINVSHLKTLVLDEFDKSLETGFEKEMQQIIYNLTAVRKKVLTSATQKVEIPDFIGLSKPYILDFLEEANQQLTVKLVRTSKKDKLDGLLQIIKHVGTGNGIIFCNLKDSIQFVSDFLTENKIEHANFYGGLEQLDRERALIKFRNGTHRLLLATDLAARGIDIPELDFIIHYQLPFKKDEFVHRNGRTARMQKSGVSYVLKYEKEALPDFILGAEELVLETSEFIPETNWQTLHISGGRQDKISKGDIAGLFFKQGNLTKEELGVIELKQDCAYVSVPQQKAQKLILLLNNSRLKKAKVKISILE